MGPSSVNQSRRNSILALSLVFGPALFLIFISTRGCDHRFKKLHDYGLLEAPAFSVYTSHGFQARSLSDYKGQVLLITTLQTTCPHACGLAFFSVKQTLYRDIRDNKRKKLKQVRLLSIVVDSLGNPASKSQIKDVYEMLRKEVNGYDPALWQLVSANAGAFYSHKHNGQSLIVHDKKYMGGISYNELILLLDKQSHLRMVINGSTEGMVRKMKEHLALLMKQYDKERAKNQ